MVNRTGKPTLGYPTQTAAVEALLAEGLKVKEIAARVGCSDQMVYTLKSQIQRRAAKATNEPAMQPGIWTPEKLAKAHQLFGKIIVMVAEKLQVPADELLAYGLKGVVPPMGTGQRLGQLMNAADIRAREDAPQQQRALPVPDPGHQRDEAELAALADEEDDDADHSDGPDVREEPEAEPLAEEDGAPGARAPETAGAFQDADARLGRPPSLEDELRENLRRPATVPAPKQVAGRADPMAVPMAAQLKERVKLHNEAGEYLHENERSMTRLSKFIWRGTPAEAKSLKRKKPQLRRLIEEAC